MISADWLGRSYVVNCFCYSHKQTDGYTAKLAIERWNEKNADEKDKTDTETAD